MTKFPGHLALVPALILGLNAVALAQGGDEHWSRQFPAPQNTTKMGPNTGMSDGHTSPRVRRVQWHDGKLWMAGAWEAGISATDTSKRYPNEYW